MRESQRVDERVEVIYDEKEFKEALEKAGICHMQILLIIYGCLAAAVGTLKRLASLKLLFTL